MSHQLAVKPAMAWASHNEEISMGNLLIKLADAVRPICASEPRLLRVNSPVYVVGKDVFRSANVNADTNFWRLT